MKTLHLHLLKQMLLTLLMTVVVFSFVMLLVHVLRDVMVLLVTGQASFPVVIKAIALLFPYVLVWSLPMGVLTATLLVFGRFSADQELTAARASGISLVSLITPVLVLALMLCGLSAYINLELAPRCRTAQKALMHSQGVVNLEKIGRTLPSGTYIDEIPGMTIYLGRTNPDGTYDNVYIYQIDEAGVTKEVTRAEHASLERGDTPNQVILVLNEFSSIRFKEDGTAVTSSSGNNARISVEREEKKAKAFRPRLDDLTFNELKKEMERRMAGLGAASSESREALLKQMKEARRQIDVTLPIKVQMQHQVSFSLACISFALIGIPLAIRAHRRETSVGIAISLVLVLVYYGFMILAEALSERGTMVPQLIVWIPNFIFQILGGGLLWRVNRGV